MKRTEKARQRRLLMERTALLREVDRKLNRRMELLNRRAPAAWLNRLTDEIHDHQRRLEVLEMELDDLLELEMRDIMARGRRAQ